MDENREADIPVIEGSGNVFADMGLPEPDKDLTKAQLAWQPHPASDQAAAFDPSDGGGAHGHRSAEGIGAA